MKNTRLKTEKQLRIVAFTLLYLLVFTSIFKKAGAQIIAANDRHSLFIVCSYPGTPIAVGQNTFGQLGDGTTINRSVPVPVNALNGIIAVACGNAHSLFLKNDGTVWACGHNGYGQLGDGTTISRSIPVQVAGVSGIIAIAAGAYHSLFLKNDSTVWACGYNAYGQLGDGTTTPKTTPVQIPSLVNITSISAGYYHSLFLKSANTAWACGYNVDGELGDGTNTNKSTPINVIGLSGIQAISCGFFHSLFLKNNATIWDCGYNGFGQLGDGTYTQRNVASQISSLSGIVAISGGGNHSLFLVNDNTVRGCGKNDNGQLGDGTTIQSNIPVLSLGLAGITTFAAGSDYSIFLKNDGIVWACGNNTFGKLGDGTTAQRVTPVQWNVNVTSSNAASICSGSSINLSLSSNRAGSNFSWLANDNLNTIGESISSQSSSVINDLITNNSIADQTVLYTVTPHSCGALAAVQNVAVTVHPIPVAPSGVSSQSFCFTSSHAVADLAATGSSIKWYPTLIGGAILSGTSILLDATHYYATQTINGCESDTRLDVMVSVNNPAAPTGAAYQSFCSSSNNTVNNLTASGAAIQWYATPSGGTPLAGADALIDGSDYYATQTLNGCESELRLATTAIINASPLPSILGATSFCGNQSANLDAGLYDNYLWSNSITTQNALINSSGIFTVTVTDVNSCTGSASVSLTLNPNPLPPLSNGDVIVCANNLPATLANNTQNGIDINWWDASTSGTLLLANSSTYLASTPGAYYSEAIDALTGCVSVTRTVVNLAVNQNPLPPISAGNLAVCASALPANLSALSQSGIALNWWDAATAGNLLLANSATFNTAVAGTYYCDAVDVITGCVSVTRTAVSLTINSNPATPVTGGNITICANALPVAVVNNVPSGVTVNWYNAPTGGSLLLAGNTSYNVNAAGTYYGEAVNPLTGCISATRQPVTVTVNANPVISISGATAFCSGNSNVLNAGAGFSSYIWSTGAGTQNITVSTSATFTVTVTNLFGCTGSASVTTAINPLPLPSITATSSFCLSANLQVSPAFNSYLWSNGVTTQNLSTSVSGTYTVTVTNENGCTASISKMITVYNLAPAQPGIISGLTSVCKNSNLPYSIALVPTANSYTWTAASGTFVSTGQGSNNVTVNFSNNAVNGNLNVVASNACGSSAARSLAYVVSPGIPTQPLTINGQLNGLCNQNNVAYNCPVVTNALSYLWTVPAGVTILSGQGTNAISVKFTSTFTGSGNISVQAQNGCGSSSVQSKLLNAKPQPVVITGQNWACKNQAGLVYSVAAVTGATTYTWTVVPGSTIVSGQGSTSIVVNWGGINGAIKCAAGNVCGSGTQGSLSVSFTCKEAGLEESFSELNLYPNPAATDATISFESYSEGKGSLEVYNLVGQQTKHNDITLVTGNNIYKLDLSTFAKGAYTVKVIYNGYTHNCKLIVQ